ncbi:MAG: DUF3426 domain-containing protein [Phenylobacterium sp.]
MILTCPECATSYFVDDSRVGPTGRAVKCSSCGAKWTALPQGLGQAEPAAAPRRQPPPAPSVDPPPEDDIVVGDAEPEAEPAISPRLAARRALPPPAPPENRAWVWVVAAGVVVGLVASLIVFRSDVVRIWPASRAAFAGVGLPANPLGLVIEKVRADPTFQGGRPVLAVSGQIRNVKTTAAMAPSLRVSLLDRAGKPLVAKVAKPIDGRVPAGAVRHFAIAIVDPPANVRDLQVTFEPAGGVSAAAGPPIAAEAVLIAPGVVDARPLPAGAPEALPPHD